MPSIRGLGHDGLAGPGVAIAGAESDTSRDPAGSARTRLLTRARAWSTKLRKRWFQMPE